MADTQTFRERTPIIARMIDRGFNGDQIDADDRVAFVLVAAGPSDEEDGTSILSVTTNCHEAHQMISMLLTAISEAQENPPRKIVIGHA